MDPAVDVSHVVMSLTVRGRSTFRSNQSASGAIRGCAPMARRHSPDSTFVLMISAPLADSIMSRWPTNIAGNATIKPATKTVMAAARVQFFSRDSIRWWNGANKTANASPQTRGGKNGRASR